MLEIQEIAAELEPARGADVCGAFAAELDASEKTRETYTRALRQWRGWLEAHGAGELEAARADVLAYRDALRAEGKSAATVNSYLTAIRSLYRWLEACGLYPNIAAGVKGLKMGKASAKDALTVEQAAELLGEAGEAATVTELRDAAIICLMIRRGLRTVEIARADVGDVRQLNGRAVLMVQGKGYDSKSDYVVLGPPCQEALYAYLEARGRAADDAPLFAGTGNRNAGGRLTTRTVSRIVKTAMERHGMKSARLTAHSTRHTAVTFALLGGATVQEAQAMARHASIETTMVYAHNLDRTQARAESAIDALIDGAANTKRTQSEHTGEHTENTRLAGQTPRGGHKANTRPNTKRTQSEHTAEAAL